MAKQQVNPMNIFARTEPKPTEGAAMNLDAGNIKAIGLGIRTGEIEALDLIAGETGITRNQLLRFIVRTFLLDYQAGKVDLTDFLQSQNTKTLRLP